MLWKKIFPLFFLYAIVDGFVSNLLFPAKMPLLYKDFLLIFVYFIFIMNENVRHNLAELRYWMGTTVWHFGMAFMFLAILQIFNPTSPGLVLGLLGFKVLFLYWPLALLGYAYITNLDSLLKFLTIIVIASVPVNIFGLFQFVKGPEFVTRFGAGFERAIFMADIEGYTGPAIKSFFRVIGTFASTGQYSSFIVVSIMSCFALIFSFSTPAKRWVYYGCQLLNFLSLLASGSRGWLLTLLVQLIVLGMSVRRIRPVLAATFVAGLSLYGGFSWLGKAVIKRYESIGEIQMLKMRSVGMTGGMLLSYLDRYPMGKGLGAGSTASRHLAENDPMLGWTLIENYPAKLQMETGIVGVVLFYAFSIALIFRLRRWLTLMHGKIYDITMALASHCLVHFSIVSLFNLLDIAPTAVFLWTMLGFVAKLSVLSISEQSAERGGAPGDLYAPRLI